MESEEVREAFNYVGKSDFEVPFIFVATQGDMSFEDLVVYCFSEGCCRGGDRRGSEDCAACL